MTDVRLICDECDTRQALGTQSLKPVESLQHVRSRGWHTEGGRYYCPACWKRLVYTRQQQGKSA